MPSDLLIRKLREALWLANWENTEWKCGVTGETFTITSPRFKELCVFGESYVDLGDLYYSRMGGSPVLVHNPNADLAEQLHDIVKRIVNNEIGE